MLLRPADPGGLATWTAFLASYSRIAMVQAIPSNTEYRSVVAQDVYQTYLGRPATAPEVSAALTILASVSGTDEQFIAAVAGTGEFFPRAGLCRLLLPVVTKTA